MMLYDIIENRNYRYELILRKPNEEILMFVPFESLSITRTCNDFIVGYNELSFTIPKEIYNQKTKSNYRNPVWDVIKQGYIIELREYDETYDSKYTSARETNREYFVVGEPKLTANSDTTSKSISCYSYHQLLLTKKKLRGFDDTRKLFDCRLTNGQPMLDINGHPYPIAYDTEDFSVGGILNYIIENIMPGWRVGYYDPALLKTENEKEYDDDFFWGDYSSTVDRDGHRILKTGLRDYWIYGAGEEALDNLKHVGKIINNMDATNKEASLFQTEYFNIVNTVNVIDWLSIDNVMDITAEPLKGAKLLAKAQSALSELRVYLQNLYNYKYVGTVCDGNLFPDEVTEYIEDVSDLCNRLLDAFITPFFNVYGDAVGKVPYRALQFDCTLGEVFESLQNSFSCIFKFDNVNKLINVYSRTNETINKETPLIISADNYMTEINYEAKTDQVTTRLYPTGKDDIWIGVNMTGQRFVDDFSYFTAFGTEMMSAELLAALQAYDALLENHKNDDIIVPEYWVCTSGSYSSHQESFDIVSLQKHIAALETNIAEARQLARTYWLTMNEEEVNGSLDSDKKKKAETKITTAQRNAVELSLDEIQKQFVQCVDFELPGDDEENIRRIWRPEYDEWNESTSDPDTNSSFYQYVNFVNCQKALADWQKQWQYENVEDIHGEKIFSDTLLTELASFIYEDDVNWNNISDDRVLYQHAKDYLEYINMIPITINIGMVDILSNYKYQLDWENITNVGTKIRVEFEDFGLNIKNSQFQFMSYTHSISPTGQDLSVVLSNSHMLQNYYDQIVNRTWADSIRQIQDINTYRKSWNDFLQKQSDLLLQGQTIEADVNNIVNSAGQVVIDGNGLSLSKSTGNGLKANSDGYYNRDKSYTSTKDIKDSTGTTVFEAGTAVRPDHIVMPNAEMTWNEDENGSTLTIEGMGGGEEIIVSPDMIEATAAFIDDLQVERLHTNLKNYICPPNLSVSGDTAIWEGGTHTYKSRILSTNIDAQIRAYITVQGTNIQLIECHLVIPADYNAITESELTPLQIAGNQVYFTKITGADAFKYLTFTSPIKKYPTLTSDEVAMYVVQIRKTDTSYVKMEHSLYYDSTNTTYNVRSVYGTGDTHGYGQYMFIKDNDGGRLVYTNRTTGAEYGTAIDDDGVKIRVGGMDCPAVYGKPYNTLEEADNDRSNLPLGAVVFVKGE